MVDLSEEPDSPIDINNNNIAEASRSPKQQTTDSSSSSLSSTQQQSTLFECKTCAKMFDNVHRLQRHMLCHDTSPELRKFKCQFCVKAFKFKHHLKVCIVFSILYLSLPNLSIYEINLIYIEKENIPSSPPYSILNTSHYDLNSQ